jgi:hypothetical protein
MSLRTQFLSLDPHLVTLRFDSLIGSPGDISGNIIVTTPRAEIRQIAS